MSLPTRLLNTSTYELHKSDHKDVRNDPRYAILSHRWCSAEIQLQDLDPAALRDVTPDTDAHNKLRGACKRAREASIKWLWADTCCIDKTNAVEETRSINAMFDWYRSAEVCYTYLHDVDLDVVSRKAGVNLLTRTKDGEVTDKYSEWFERGWTLQELLAPKRMFFYDRHWNFIAPRDTLAKSIEQASGIAEKYLDGSSDLNEASIATKLSWMAGRVTGHVEDIAYSMIGLLNVNMTPQYGEGRKAFMRLQRTLIETTPDESVFAWTVPHSGLQCFRRNGAPASSAPQWKPQGDRWGLLAPSPDCFRDSRDIFVDPSKVVIRPGSGYRQTNQGIHFDMAAKGGRGFFGNRKSKFDFPLNCWRLNAAGKSETILLKLTRSGERYERERCGERLSSDARAKPDNNIVMGQNQMIVSPLLVFQPEDPR